VAQALSLFFSVEAVSFNWAKFVAGKMNVFT
jgi:hypothetical protein